MDSDPERFERSGYRGAHDGETMRDSLRLPPGHNKHRLVEQVSFDGEKIWTTISASPDNVLNRSAVIGDRHVCRRARPLDPDEGRRAATLRNGEEMT